MIDLNQATKQFSILHADTGSHDEAIRRLAAHYYQRGLEEANNAPADQLSGRKYGIIAEDQDPPRYGCHTGNPAQAEKIGMPCTFKSHKLPACEGCGRRA